MGKIIIKTPAVITKYELNRFYKLLKLGDQVKLSHLKQKITKAHFIAFYIEKREIVAIGGLKNPSIKYKNHIFKAAKTDLNAHEYQHELGWAFTLPEFRGQRIGEKIFLKLLKKIPKGTPLFATTRTDNIPAQKLLLKLDFKKTGTPYKSRKGNYRLELFLR